MGGLKGNESENEMVGVKQNETETEMVEGQTEWKWN